eukprot:c8991_g2_i1.p1 GENE.c8991_g2_i1~~c8991_g2_i1.p1  ORF type:complete len:156 (+),score=19.23 c8991_g2_i1:207-674(+)
MITTLSHAGPSKTINYYQIYSAPRTPFPVRSVHIPGYQTVGGTTFYVISVLTNDGSPSWELRYRYKRIHAIYDYLSQFVPNTASSFPPKKLFSLSDVELEERRQGLESWLTEMVSIAPQNGRVEGVLRNFFQLSSYHRPDQKPSAPDACDAVSFR